MSTYGATLLVSARASAVVSKSTATCSFVMCFSCQF
jgi:hypothetical protein